MTGIANRISDICYLTILKVLAQPEEKIDDLAILNL
jgi:hypothetical protein